MPQKENFQDISTFSFNRLIRYLNNVLRMGRIVQGMLYKFGDAYIERKIDLSKEIIQQDDRIDLMEADLEYESIVLLSSYNFTGIYLKSCFIGSRLIQRFENMADLIEKNSKLNIDIMNNPYVINTANFEDVIEITKEIFSYALLMLSDFINIEAKKLKTKETEDNFFKKAKNICIANKEIDSLIKAYKSYLYKFKENFKVISFHLEILNNIETFSDLTTNLSEDIIWALTGDLFKCRDNEMELFYSLGEE